MVRGVSVQCDGGLDGKVVAGRLLTAVGAVNGFIKRHVSATHPYIVETGAGVIVGVPKVFTVDLMFRQCAVALFNAFGSGSGGASIEHIAAHHLIEGYAYLARVVVATQHYGVAARNGAHLLHIDASLLVARVVALMVEMCLEEIKNLIGSFYTQLGPHGKTYVVFIVIPTNGGACKVGGEIKDAIVKQFKLAGAKEDGVEIFGGGARTLLVAILHHCIIGKLLLNVRQYGATMTFV